MRALILCLALLSGCGSGPLVPVAIDPRNDACRHCRMLVSNARTAAEILAPGEEPVIFDDLGCLRDFIAATPLSGAERVYVVDHRTAEWVPAHVAVYTKSTHGGTAMGSGLIAHRDVASRDADPAAAGGSAVTIAAIFGDAARAREVRE